MTDTVRSAIDNLVDAIYSEVRREMYDNDQTGTITPEEAVVLAGRQPFAESLLGRQVYKALCKEYGENWASSSVFTAGKIAGIRQERARRKAGNRGGGDD